VGVDVRVGTATDLDEVLAGAQVAALPFRMDATITPALVAAEAMAVGLPVVASDVPCLNSLVRDGHNGRVVAPRDPRAIADAALDVLSSEERWRTLSEAARRTIEDDWHWDGAAGVVHDAYRYAQTRRRRSAA
jgi:glycosyltransferase involved in cell wall biosynthesis